MSPDVFFQWQNKKLRDSIYPFREIKLRDFLLIYKEVDLWAVMKNQNTTDPAIATRLQSLRQKAQAEHDQVAIELNAAIEERKKVDTWFAKVTHPDPKRLRDRQIYYLDRVINDQTQREAELLARQKSLLKKAEWYKVGDSRRTTWEGRAAEVIAPLQVVGDELKSLRKVRELFDKQDRLPRLEPNKPLTMADLARVDLNEYQKRLEAMDIDTLTAEVWKKLQERKPDGKPRFEKWFQYMIVHFSGMRYISAHGSWADPDELLELLVREDMKSKLARGEDIDDKTENEVQRLLRAPVDATTKNLSPVLKALVVFKKEKDEETKSLPEKERLEKAIPDWAWQEITKFTQLRLGTTDTNWEAISPDRWDYETRRWREIMDSWQREDITKWRQEHKETLELIVTRAVCNEIAEHIQHLRGNAPAGGLTSKPNWYLNAQSKFATLPATDPKRSKAYFRKAMKDTDFIPGASVFWLGWVPKEPNAWQVARPISGIDLLSGAKAMDGRTKDSKNWTVRFVNNAWIRTRQPELVLPSVQELRRQGMTDREIEKRRMELRAANAQQKEYLRWKHEATVVEVVERIDGEDYVLTFETGKIGLNWHTVDDLVNSIDEIFVGYIPPTDNEPENLAKMLDATKILAKSI